MNEIPSWWLAVSAIFFIVNILLFCGWLFAIFKLVQFMKEVTPKINEISGKVGALVVKVEQVAERVEEVATSVKETVDGVGGRAKGVVGSVELVAQSASRQFERFSPFIVGAMTAMRLIKSLNEMRHGRSAASATKKKNLKDKPVTLFGKAKK
jgi:hypothetical protein